MHLYVLFCWLALLLCRYYKVTNGTLLHCFPRKANMYPTKLCILIRLTLNWGLSSMYILYSQPLHNTMYSPSKHFQRKNILHTPLSALYSWSNIEYFFHFDINFWHFWSSWSISNLYWLQWSEDDKFFKQSFDFGLINSFMRMGRWSHDFCPFFLIKTLFFFVCT